MRSDLPTHRGVALLLALVVLSVFSTAAVGIARTATNRSLASQHSSVRFQARILIVDLEPLLDQWLIDHADQVRDDDSERIEWLTILDSVEGNVRVYVRRLDLGGRLHYRYLGSRAARRGLPDELSQIRYKDPLEDLNRKRRGGADQPELPSPLLDEIIFQSDSSISVYPNDDGLCAIEWLTTTGSAALNVNACPRELLNAALRQVDPALRRQAMEFRESGELIPDGLVAQLERATRRQPGDERESTQVPLSGSSDSFGFLVDVEQEGRSTHYWIVAERQRDSGRERWVFVQRRRI